MVHHEGTRRVHLHCRLAGAQPLVKVALGEADAESLFAVEVPVGVHSIPERSQFLLPRVIVPVGRGFHAANEGPAIVEVNVGKERAHLLGVDDAQRVQESGHAHPAPAVDADGDGFGQVAPPRVIVSPGLHFDAGAPAGRDAALVVPVLQLAALGAGGVLGGFPFVVNPRCALQLADQDALGAVDDESARPGHHRHVAEENVGLGNLPGFLVPELRFYVKRPGIRDFPFPAGLRAGVSVALTDGFAEVAIFLGVKPVIHEVQFETFGPARSVSTGKASGDSGNNRRAIAEGFGQTVGLEPVERLDLAANEVRHVKGVRDSGI